MICRLLPEPINQHRAIAHGVPKFDRVKFNTPVAKAHVVLGVIIRFKYLGGTYEHPTIGVLTACHRQYRCGENISTWQTAGYDMDRGDMCKSCRKRLDKSKTKSV